MTQTNQQQLRAFCKGIGLKPIDPDGDIGVDLDFAQPSEDGAPRDLKMITGLDVLLQDLEEDLENWRDYQRTSEHQG
jgi:hypothetical protein